MLSLTATMAVFGWSYTVLMPILAEDILGRGARGMNHLVSCNGIGAPCGGLAAPKLSDSMRPRPLVFTGIGIFFAAVSVVAFSKVFWLSAVALAFGGLFPMGSLISGTPAHAIGSPTTVFIGGCVCVRAAVTVSRLMPPVKAPLPKGGNPVPAVTPPLW